MIPRGRNAPKLWPAEPVNLSWIVSSGSPAPPYRRVSSLPEDRADGAVDVADRQLERDRLAPLERRPACREQRRHVERLLEPVILVADLADGDVRPDVGPVEDLAEIEALGLVVVDGLAHLEQVAAADHLVDRAEAELGHQLAHFLGDELEEVDDVLGLAAELLAELGVLGGDADRAGIEVADPHHDAAHHHQGGGGEAVFLGAQERGDHDVAAGLELAVGLDDDPVAELVQDEGLLGLGQPELPGDAGVLERGQRAGAGAAVVAADQDDVAVGLGHARRDRADAHLGHQLDADPRPAGCCSSGRRSTGRGLRSNRCRGAAAG